MDIEVINTLYPEKISVFIVDSFNEGNHFFRQFLDDLDYYSGYSCSDGEGIFLAKVDNKVVGILGLYKDKYHNPKLGYFKHVYVLPQYRKKGIATALLKQAILHASPNFESISVTSPNEFYDKLLIRLGFVHIRSHTRHTFMLNIINENISAN